MGDWVKKSDNNGRPYKERVVGYIDVAPGSIYHDTSFETASYWRDVALEPGRYDILENDWNGTGMVSASIPGKVAGAYTPSSFGGVPFGNNPSGENHPSVGNETVARPSTYAFTVHVKVKELFGHPFTLTEMELERNHQHAVETKSLTALMGNQFKDAKRDILYSGTSINDMAYAGRLGDTVVMLAPDKKSYVLIPESETQITGPFGDCKNIDSGWEHATVVRRLDGSLYVNAGLEQKKQMLVIDQHQEQSQELEPIITAEQGKSRGR